MFLDTCPTKFDQFFVVAYFLGSLLWLVCVVLVYKNSTKQSLGLSIFGFWYFLFLKKNLNQSGRRWQLALQLGFAILMFATYMSVKWEVCA